MVPNRLDLRASREPPFALPSVVSPSAVRLVDELKSSRSGSIGSGRAEYRIEDSGIPCRNPTRLALLARLQSTCRLVKLKRRLIISVALLKARLKAGLKEGRGIPAKVNKGSFRKTIKEREMADLLLGFLSHPLTTIPIRKGLQTKNRSHIISSASKKTLIKRKG
jgi:hypothetical protein